MSDPDYHIEIEGIEPEPGADTSEKAPRAWIGVRFDCCGVYVRIWRNKSGTAYEGRCPRCLRTVRAKVGPGGTNQRMFVAE